MDNETKLKSNIYQIETDNEENDNSTSKQYQNQFIITCLLGQSNQSPSEVIISLAHDLAHKQNKVNLVQLFGFLYHIVCIVSVFLSVQMSNSSISLSYRQSLIFLAQIVSFQGLMFYTGQDDSKQFYIILMLILPEGIAGGIGEPTIISMVSRYIGSENLAGQGFGTGLAGILSPVVLILFNWMHIDLPTMFLIFSFTTMIYFLTQSVFYKFYIIENDIVDEIGQNLINNGEENVNEDNNNNFHQDNSYFTNFMIKTWQYQLTLFLIQFLSKSSVYTLGEYYSNRFENSSKVNFINILMFQIGMCIGRTIISLLKHFNSITLIIVQVLIFLGLIVILIYDIEQDFRLMQFIMFIEGLICGGQQIRSFYLIGQDNRLSSFEKEQTINQCCIATLLGSCVSFLFGVAFYNTHIKL